MKALSTFKIPEKYLTIFQQNFIKSSVDYQRFSFNDKDHFLSLLSEYFPNYGSIDCDNSNVMYVHSGSLTRFASPRGSCFIYTISYEGIGPVPLCLIEMYGEKSKLPSCGRIDFYGSFFHFSDNIPSFLSDLYSLLVSSGQRCTRLDIALDFSCSFPPNNDILKFFRPYSTCKKKRVNTYFDYSSLEDSLPPINSASYLPKKNTGYGARVYDKLLDIRDKNKQAWYTDLPEKLTRIEFEFYPPYSSNFSIDYLSSYLRNYLLGKDCVELGLPYRPNYGFNIENAYNYVQRYCKSKGVSFDRFIRDLVEYHEKIIGHSVELE